MIRPHDPQFRALPPDLQARLEVRLALRGHVAALEHLTRDLTLLLGRELPNRTAYAAALAYHVRLLRLYFEGAEAQAQGLTSMERAEVRRDG